MAVKKTISKRGVAKRKNKTTSAKRSSATRKGGNSSTGTSSRQERSGQAQGNTAARLGELARDVARLGDELRRGAGVTSAGNVADNGDAAGRVSAATLRRLELMAILLDKETHDLGGGAGGNLPGSSAPAIPRTSLAFSWVPEVSVDNNGVTVGVSGVGEVSIGAGGAAASVDGVGGASISPSGVSVSAGGVSVSVGGTGAQVTMPGAGTVSVGPDGSVSVSPGKGGDCVSSLPFPTLPIPSLCASEFKIPIPVPRFVVEPFEIPVNVPRLDPSPLSIAIPAPTLEPMPIKIPYPTFDLNIGSPQLGELSSFDAIMDVSVAALLENMIGDMKKVLKSMVKQLRDQDEAAGNPDQQRVSKIAEFAEATALLLAPIRDTYKSLRGLVMQSPVVITEALLAVWGQFQTLAASLLKRLDALLEAIVGMVSPADVVVAIVRQIYLIIGWILARAVRGTLKMSEDVTSRLLQIGARLHAQT